jgi:c-di-GMP-binding flagellar brake protein YcgR
VGEGRQRYERVDILGELPGEVMIFQPMVITQISLGGARIETTFPLHLDSLHDFRLTLGSNLSVVVKGRIVHCRISDVDQEQVTYRAGVEFVELPEHVKTAISEFIARLKEARERIGNRGSGVSGR